jgi:hypothetical protein
VISCPIRVLYNQKAASTIAIPGQTVNVVFTLEQVPIVEIKSATKSDDLSTNVAIAFRSVPSNSMIGPLQFGYKFGTEVRRIDQPDPLPGHLLGAIDSKISFGRDMYLHQAVEEWWIVTGPNPDVTATWETTFNVLSPHDQQDFDGQEYSAFITVAAIQDGEDKPLTSDKVIGTIELPKTTSAQIWRNGNTVRFSQSLTKASTAQIDFSFGISGYDADVVFGTDAKMWLSVAGQPDVAIPITAKEFAFKLAVTAGKTVAISGEFPVTGDWVELNEYTGTLDGSTASAKMHITPIIKPSIGTYNKESGEVSLTLDILAPEEAKAFKSAIKYRLFESEAVPFQRIGDARAADAYFPKCTSDSVSFKLDEKQTKDGLDLNFIGATISGTLSSGQAAHRVECVHKLRTGPRSMDSIEWFGIEKALIPVATRADYKQTLRVNSAEPITSAAVLTKLLDQVVKALKDAFPAAADGFNGLVTKDFHYTASDIQYYDSYAAGFLVDLAGPFATPFNRGAELVLGFTPSGVDEAKFIAKAGTFYFETLKLTLESLSASAYSFDLVYLNGSDDAVYSANQAVSHGYGIACATTQQCALGYCNNNLCVGFEELTLAQQTALKRTYQDGDQDDSASALFTTVALIITMLVAVLA